MAGTGGNRLPAPLFELLCYLVTSARGLVDEPAAYGPFRLIDAASRLIAALGKVGIGDEFGAGFRQRIEDNKTLARDDPDGFVCLIDELAVELARELKHRREP